MHKLKDSLWHGDYSPRSPYGPSLVDIKQKLAELPWEVVKDKAGLIKRSSCWMTMHGCTCSYGYGNKIWQPTSAPTWLCGLSNRVMEICGLGGYMVCGINANKYDNGAQNLWWHADDERLFKTPSQSTTIVSLSIGSPRDFELKKNFSIKSNDTFKVVNIGSGDLLVMTGAFQQHWQHRIPPNTVTSSAPRYNLTFRFIARHSLFCLFADDPGKIYTDIFSPIASS